MVEVRLDTAGRLVSFHAVPPARRTAGGTVAEPDWDRLFARAGFDPAEFEPVDPEWTPPVYADRRVAWVGVYPEATDIPIRIEAAAFDGRPVSFRIVAPWTEAEDGAPDATGFWARAPELVGPLWLVFILIAASIVAIRNVRLGHGDRRTALRLALYLGAVRLLWMAGANHLPSAEEIGIFTGHLAWSLYRVGIVYVFYLAIEPYARKLWPGMLVSWVRLAGGKFRDPLVGRDVLVGVAYGILLTLTWRAVIWLPGLVGLEGYGAQYDLWSLESLRGFRHAFGAVAGVHATSVTEMFYTLTLFLVLRLLLRRTWITIGIISLMILVMYLPDVGHPAPYLIVSLVMLAMFWFVLLRFGLLAATVGFGVRAMLTTLPLTFDLFAWHANATRIVLVLIVGLAAWGFTAATAGRPLFRDSILGERRAGR